MSKPWRKQPVPPLSEQAWNRVREGVFPELELDESARRSFSASPRRRGYRMAAGVIGLVAAAVLVLFVVRSQVLKDASPVPSRIVAAQDVTRATIGDVLVEVAPGTELVVTGTEQAGHTVVLERGQATFTVPKRAGRARFGVQAGDALVEVVGTKFGVLRSNDLVRVSVTVGTVRVTFRGEETLLTAGREWASRPPSSLTPPPAEPAPAATPSTVSGSETRQRTPQGSAPESEEAAAPPPRASATQPEASSARERYEAASRIEPSDPERASVQYLELANGTGVWAANALYAAARLDFERSRTARAKSLLEQYLKRFPNGTNAQEARLLLERMQPKN